MEHVWVFLGFVFSFGNTNNHYLGSLAEIKFGGTDKVADIFDEKYRVLLQFKPVHGAVNHIRIKMAAAAGVDLHNRSAGGLNPLRIPQSLLIPFNNRKGDVFKCDNGFSKIAVLPEPGELTRLSASMELSSK